MIEILCFIGIIFALAVAQAIIWDAMRLAGEIFDALMALVRRGAGNLFPRLLIRR